MNTLWTKTILAAVIGLGAGIATRDIGVGAALFAVFCIIAWAPFYHRYAQDNPQKFWFKRKLFGWGWTPVTWQGWSVIVGYVVVVGLLGFTINDNSSPRELGLLFILPVFTLTASLIYVAYRKGEKPKWQWGKDINKYSK